MTVDPAFYATAAQTLPVLFLVFAVQHRELLFAQEEERTPSLAEGWQALLMIAALLLGEAAALSGVVGNGGPGHVRAIVLALAWSFLLIILPLVLKVLRAIPSAVQGSASGRQGVFGVGLTLVALIVLLARSRTHRNCPVVCIGLRG